MELIRKIKEEVKISSYFDKSVLIKTSNGWKTLSPFTKERTPSFMIVDKDGIEVFNDYSFGKSGDIFSFLMLKEKKTFYEVYSDLLLKLNIKIKPIKKKSADVKYLNLIKELSTFFYDTFLKRDDVKEYLIEKRFLNQESLDMFYLGFCENGIINFLEEKEIDKNLAFDLGLIGQNDDGSFYDKIRNRIIIPLFNMNNEIIGFSNRKYLETDTAGKYINPPNNKLFKKNSFIYGLNLASEKIKEKDSVIITEGYLDCIKLHQKGITNSVCVSGTNLFSDQVKILSKLTTKFYFCFDGDSAGRLAIIKNIKEVVKQGGDIFIIELPDGDDPDDYLNKNSKEDFLKLVNNSKNILEFIKDSKSEMIPILEEISNTIKKISSDVRREFWYKNILEYIGIDLKQDIKKEYYLQEIVDEMSENDNKFFKYYLNSDADSKKILLENNFLETEKAKLLLLKLNNDTYKIEFDKEEQEIINSLSLKNKEYKSDEVLKIIDRIKKEKKLLNES